MSLRINWDALGITASLACAIHCAVLPLFLSGLPLFGFEIIDNLWFESFMILLAFAIGVYALHHGYKKHHQNKFPILLFSAGFILLICKQIWHPLQLLFLIPAVLLIVSAHYINLKFYKKKMRSNKIPIESYPG